jgi:hypothetical protein
LIKQGECIFDVKAADITVLITDKPGEGMKPDFGTPDILSRREAAAVLGICRATLDRLDIPRTRVRHRVLYKRDVLIKWIDEHTEKGMKGKSEPK